MRLIMLRQQIIYDFIESVYISSVHKRIRNKFRLKRKKNDDHLSRKHIPYFLATEFAPFQSLWAVLGRWTVREQRQLALNIKHLWQLSLDDSSYCRTI